jgi:putative ATP-dependent endonuclease of OLD family
MLPGRLEVDGFATQFARGVRIRLDDGVETEVLDKGHGIQRCMVFALLQAYIENQRGTLTQGAGGAVAAQPGCIILLVEEPELYIHPQMQRRIHRVLRQFAETDQVICTTHCPTLVDVRRYDELLIARKHSATEGTALRSCDNAMISFDPASAEAKFLKHAGGARSGMFFARQVLLGEGPADIAAVEYVAKHEGWVDYHLDEVGLTPIAGEGASSLPVLAEILNSFSIPFQMVLDKDPQNPDIASSYQKACECAGRLGRPVRPWDPNLEGACGTVLGKGPGTHHFHNEHQIRAFLDAAGVIPADLMSAAKLIVAAAPHPPLPAVPSPAVS